MRLSRVGVLSALLIGALFLSFIYRVSAQTVSIEYFYMTTSPNCPECKDDNVKRVDEVIRLVESSYGAQVSIERIDILTPEGRERWNSYDLGLFRPAVALKPTLFVNSTRVMKDTPLEPITRESLSAAVDEYLGIADTDGTNPVTAFQRFLSSDIFLALSMGFFSGFSPCLMAMLAFILAYSTGESKGLKSGVFRTSIFGLGLVAAIMMIGVFILFFQLPLSPIIDYLHAVTWAASIIMILVGLNLIGVLKLPFTTKPFIQRLAGKHGYSLIGLFLFGILFFFVKVPCAFPLFVVLLANMAIGTTTASISVFTAFSIGILVPFLGVGLVSGGAPKLAKEIREKHRTKIRALSGLILIIYGIWLILWQIL